MNSAGHAFELATLRAGRPTRRGVALSVRAAFMGLAVVLCLGPTSAQGPAVGANEDLAELVVTETIQRALAQSPAVAAARSRLAAAEQRERPAGALPDPMLEAMLQNAGIEPSVGEEEMSMVGVVVRQRLPYPGKRAAARAAAAAEARVLAAEVVRLERQVATAAATQLAELWAVDRELDLLAAAAELLDLLEEVSLARYGSGVGDLDTVLSLQVEALELAAQRDDLLAERQTDLAELARILGQPPTAPAPSLLESLPLVAPRPALSTLGEAATAISPEVALTRARLDLAEHQVAVAQLGLQPDLSAGAGLASRRDLDPVVLLEFGVEIPLWRRDKQQPLVRAAELERDAAQAELTNATTTAYAQAVAIQTAWANAEAQIARYREGILPQSATALDAARGAYLAGEGAFATVVGAFRRWLDVRLALTRRQRDQFVAERQWVELFGPEESEDG